MKQRLLIPFCLVWVLGLFSLPTCATEPANTTFSSEKKIAYLVSDIQIPYWKHLSLGIQTAANQYGYRVEIYSSANLAKNEFKNILEILKQDYSGIVLSPTSSSAAATVLRFINPTQTPTVIADIGTESGDYVSYISSDNYNGGYELGKKLLAMLEAHQIAPGKIGIIAIPQNRANGRARTSGFMSAIENSLYQGAGIKQQQTFSYQETYDFCQEFIQQIPDLRVIWLQGSNRYAAALKATEDFGKQDQINVITFDAEPEFLEMIPAGKILASAMQQPFLIGQKSIEVLHQYFQGHSVSKEIKLPVVVVSNANIQTIKPSLFLNVFGQTPPRNADQND